jgi:hypothetical protein
MLVYPRHHARSKSMNPMTTQLPPKQQSHQKLPSKSANEGRGGSISNKTSAQPPHAKRTQWPTLLTFSHLHANASSAPTTTSSLAAWKTALSPPQLQTALALSGLAPQTTHVGNWLSIQQPICPPRWQDKKATEITEYPFKVQEPMQELHITPSITKNLLPSTGKFAAANYITIFDKGEVNIYGANNTIIAVIKEAILQR